jgi:DNA repair exonuclease SbcCD ATPase subunit
VKDVRLRRLGLEGFRSFRKHQHVEFPHNGLVLVRGYSGTGKSNFALGLAYALGYCDRPSTALKSWDHDGRWSVDLDLKTNDAEVSISRGSSFSLDVNQEPVKGLAKVKEEALAKELGLGPELLKPLTYRPQRTTGLFLSKTDEQKKEFLSQLLRLDEFEREAENAAKLIAELEAELASAKGDIDKIQGLLQHLDSQSYPFEPTDAARMEIVTCRLKLQQAEEQLKVAQADVEAHKVETRRLQGISETEQQAKYDKLKAEWEAVKETRPPVPEIIESEEEKKLAIVVKQAGGMIDSLSKSDTELRTATEQQAREVQSLLKDLRDRAALKSTTQVQIEVVSKELEILAQSKCDRCLRVWEGEQIAKATAGAQERLSRLEILYAKCNTAALAIPDVEAKLEGLVFVPNQKIEQLRKAKTSAEQKLFIMRSVAIKGQSEWLRQYEKEDTRFEKDLSTLFYEKRDIRDQIEREREHILFHLQAIVNGAGTQVRKCTQLVAEAEGTLAKIDASNNVREGLESRRRADLTINVEKRSRAWDKYNEIRGRLNAERDFALLTGREGYLSTIFTEVLEQIADEVNSILVQVPNVQAVTLSFLNEKVNKSGSKKTGITAMIQMDGQVRPYADLSGGQTSMVELATDIAIRRVITRRTGIHMGWMVLDESFDGLGKREKEHCMKVLQQAATEDLIIVIDHASEFQSMFPSVIDIEHTEEGSRFV